MQVTYVYFSQLDLRHDIDSLVYLILIMLLTLVGHLRICI